jgi:hypothetical protein
MNWESLIAERIEAHRDTYAPQRIEDSGKRRLVYKERRRSRTPKRIEYRRKYREEHREELIAKRHKYNSSDHGRKVNSEYNKLWRAKNKEYDRKRKQEWWRRTHPNPRPVGRPKKEAA